MMIFTQEHHEQSLEVHPTWRFQQLQEIEADSVAPQSFDVCAQTSFCRPSFPGASVGARAFNCSGTHFTFNASI
jgi:hypothetical protein